MEIGCQGVQKWKKSEKKKVGLVPRLRMSRAIPAHPLHAFMVWVEKKIYLLESGAI
jgi:hypothetical protein